MEWIYYASVLVGLVDMFTTDYETLRIDALQKGQRISEWEFFIVKTVLSFIPIWNTFRGVRWILKILNNK